MNDIDFGEFLMYFTEVQKEKNSYRSWHMESNYLKGFSIQTVHSIELKFGIYTITGYRRKNTIDFGDCRVYSFFTGVQKSFLMHYGL